MMSATEGEVWLDERAALRIKKRFNFDFVGKQLFKGFAQKQSVYVLRGRKAESELLFEGEMIGRDSELRMLTDFVAPVWSGKYAGVIGVWGEAGMGKSRLIHEFRHSPLFEENRALWALCQSDQILRHSFNPIRYWLYRYFGVLPGEGEASRSQKFQRKLDTLISLTVDEKLSVELNRTRSFLAALVDLNWPDSLYSQLDAQSRYDNTIIALISLIKAESLQQPLFLFLEDAHFLDEDSKAFLQRLKRALTVETIDYPIAILLTTRWQGIRVVLEEGLVDHDIDLSALSSAAISQLAAGILENPADPALINLIDERAEGNPFFAEQILRYLQVEDNLELGSIGWTVRKNWKSTSLPADISTMLIARLDQLTNQVKEVVHAASILGREFEVQILSRMLANDVSLHDEIVEAEKASVWFPLNEIRYIFKHSLMRDVAYNMQLKTRRQELHAVALDALEGLYENELQHHYGELAYHSEQAALVEKAQSYLVLAGDLARDTYQNLQALDYYRRALGFAPTEALEHRYNLHRECEKVLTELGELDERTLELETLHSLADKMGEAGKQAEVEMLKSQIFVSRGQYDKSVELAKRATEEALHRNRYDVAINAYQILFDSYYQQGMYNEAIRYGELGLELSRSHGIPRDKAFILNRLGLAFLDLKDPSTATSYFAESLDMFRADDNLRGVARVLANLGVVAGHRGDFSAALGYFEQALDLAREIGTRRGEALLLGNLGWISGLLGNYRNALGYAERNLRVAREIGDKYLETYSLINLSSHAGALGDTEVAITYAEQGLELARQSNDRNAEAWALTYLGHGLLDSGTLSEAMKAYQAALILRNELDQSVLATEPEAGLARVALALGEQSEALTFVESIMSQLQRDSGLEGTDQLMRVYLSCYLALRSVNDARAPEVLNTAYRLLKKRADGIADPSARQLFLESIIFNKELMSIWNEQNPG
jgi:tetratricopeptide (TPR) repeat protein